MLLPRRKFLGILAGAIAAPIVVRSGLLMPVRQRVFAPVDTWMVSSIQEENTEYGMHAMVELIKTYEHALAEVTLPSAPPAGSAIIMEMRYDGAKRRELGNNLILRAKLEVGFPCLVNLNPGDMVNFNDMGQLERVPHPT